MFRKVNRLSLTRLNMESTKLGDSGAVELSKLLLQHPCLADLNLAQNRITDKSCHSLSHLISGSNHLTTLSLHWNLIT